MSPPITIAISGPSSSGKSTLAYLLSLIFSTSTSTKPATILNQDHYLHPKSSVPLTTFQSASTPTDISFVAKSAKEKAGLYTYTKLPGTGKEKWALKGPNTDCAEAVNFSALLKDVKVLKHGTERMRRGRERKMEEYKTNLAKERKMRGDGDISGLEGRGLCDGNAGAYTGLVLAQQLRVKKALDKLGAGWKFLWVEGFLLFSSPSSISASLRELKKMRQELMGLFDIKLFLPVGKEEAKRRRFGRSAYMDMERGGLRVPGQMWRCEGYFGWLLGNGGKERGIDVWKGGKWGESEDKNVERVVGWAVGVILGRLGGL